LARVGAEALLLTLKSKWTQFDVVSGHRTHEAQDFCKATVIRFEFGYDRFINVTEIFTMSKVKGVVR